MSEPATRVLLVEDDAADAWMLGRLSTAKGGARLELEHVDRLTKGLDRLEAVSGATAQARSASTRLRIACSIRQRRESTRATSLITASARAGSSPPRRSKASTLRR